VKSPEDEGDAQNDPAPAIGRGQAQKGGPGPDEYQAQKEKNRDGRDLEGKAGSKGQGQLDGDQRGAGNPDPGKRLVDEFIEAEEEKDAARQVGKLGREQQHG
jgi:hypothetical protein